MKGWINMTMRNLLKPGDFVSLVPVGVHLTLQYNSEGNLEKVYTGFKEDRVDHSNELRSTLVQNHVVPGKVHIKHGTSWVMGVLYTNEVFNDTGYLPKCVQDSLLNAYIKNPDHFSFFAFDFESTMTEFKGATPIRQALAMSRFNILPGWLVPSSFTDDTVNTWINSPQYTFNHIITDYIVYHKGTVNYISANTSQFVANKVVKYTDMNGYVKGKIYENSEVHMCVDYSDVVRLNIQPNTLLIVDNTNQLIFAKPTDDKKRDKRPSSIVCKCCGKTYQVPYTGVVQCPDTHCVSKLLPNVIQFFNTLGIVAPASETITDWLSSQKILCIPDILSLKDYQELEVDVTVSKLLRAIVPVSVIPRDDIFILFANACNNNVKSVRYYVNNPALITADLGLTHADLPKLLNWLNDDCNATDIQSLLDAPQLKFKNLDKRFDGPPIFRNKLIYITGEFIRGNSAEIAAILQSYSARVTLQFSEDIHCVLVGSRNENIDGRSITSAHNLGISVMDEESFFNYYQIDEDLKANLV